MLPSLLGYFANQISSYWQNNHISGGYQLTSNVNRYTTDTYEPLICYYHQTGAKEIYFLAKKIEIELQDILTLIPKKMLKNTVLGM